MTDPIDDATDVPIVKTDIVIEPEDDGSTPEEGEDQ